MQAVGDGAAAPVIAKMQETLIDDVMTRNGRLRQDGRVVRGTYVMRARRPREPRGEWDLLEVVETIPDDDAFRSINETGCPLVEGVR